MSTTHPKQIHACLMQLFANGVLIIGPAKSGKSQLCLGLLDRGHRFIADDAVELAAHDANLFGQAPAAGVGLLQTNSLGIIQVTRHYSSNASQGRSAIHLVLELDSSFMGYPINITAEEHVIGDWVLPKLRLNPTRQLDLALSTERLVYQFLVATSAAYPTHEETYAT